MTDYQDDTVDYDEISDALDIGYLLNSRPFQEANNIDLRATVSRYQKHLDILGIKYFSADEVLFLGGQHYATGSLCKGLNETPAEHIWENMDPTIKELDAFRDEIGVAIFINSTYRNRNYNKCVDGAKKSLHLVFNAIDFRSNTIKPKELARALRIRRDNGLFSGGIGIYNSFVHIDTRGVNKNFKGKNTSQSDFEFVFGK